MPINNLHDFIVSYFKAHQCSLLHNDGNSITVQLTESLDRALMNRPFYWHYIKQMGYDGEPKVLTLITNPDKRDGKNEWIHYGSPRLHQIINHLHEQEKYTKLYENAKTETNTALSPWLVTNIKLSYQGKQKKDEIISIGLHLVNGTMKLEMMETLQKKSLQSSIPDYSYTIAPMIKLHSGFNRIEKVLESYVYNQDHEWAENSLKKMDEEIDLLKQFYKDEEDESHINQEVNDIKKRYLPKIIFEVINGGVFYLTDNS